MVPCHRLKVFGDTTDFREKVKVLFSQAVLYGPTLHHPRTLTSSRSTAAEGLALKKKRHSGFGESSRMSLAISSSGVSSMNSILKAFLAARLK